MYVFTDEHIWEAEIDVDVRADTSDLPEIIAVVQESVRLGQGAMEDG